MNLKDKVVLVTGSSSGIGEATAVAFAKEGATVLVHYRKNKKGAQKTLAEVNNYSSGKMYQADLSELPQVKDLFKEIRKDYYSNINTLVNNAGDVQPGDIDDYKLWDYEWKNILMTAVITTNEFLSFSEGRDPKRIINVSSLYGESYSGNLRLVQYSAMKAALNNWTMNLTKTVSSQVLVSAVAPGYVAWEGTLPKRLQQEIERRTHIKRLVEPEEIADGIVFLAKSNSIHGEILHIDGGVRPVDLP